MLKICLMKSFQSKCANMYPNLGDSEFKSIRFNVLHSGKARSLVTSCNLSVNQLILADASGNVWAIDTAKSKKQWSIKLKHGLRFGFHFINGQLFAFHEKGLVRISKENGEIETLVTFRHVHSPVLINDHFYLQESAQGSTSKGNLIKINPITLKVDTLYEESTKRSMGNIYSREICAWSEDRILFFADSHLRSYDVGSGVIASVLEDKYQNIAGLLTVNDHVFFIPNFDWERDKSLRQHPHFQRMLHVDSNLIINIVEDEDQFSGSLSYSGSSLFRRQSDAIATFAGLAFHINGKHYEKIGRLIANDQYPRLPNHSKLVQFKDKTYIFFDASYGNYAEEVGFVISEVGANNQYTRLERYITGKRGKNFGTNIIHAFDDYLAVCGDGHYHLLQLK